jgi:hypothetical protein
MTISRLALRAGITMAVGLAAALGPAAIGQAGATVAGGPGTWTKVTGTDSGFNQAGMLRTADGALHLVWRKQLANGHFSFGWSTISLGGKLRASGIALSNWLGLQSDPKLVPDHDHIRLVFIGGHDTNLSNFFSRGSVYTEVSSNGKSWALVHGSMANHTVLNRDLAAVVKQDGTTPVAAFGLNNVLFFHQGVDPAAPAVAADGTAATGPVDTGIDGDVLSRAKNGSIWVGWFDEGYRVRQILPSPGASMKAPRSGTKNGPDNEPRQSVAFAARSGGGLYLAYCSPAPAQPCAHIDLWRVGSSKVLVVPGSGTGSAGKVALAAAPGGRLWISWFDFGTNSVHAVRTNKAATSFGVRRSVKQPLATFIFNGLQSEGSSGRLDVVVNVLLTTIGNPIEFWHTQILPGLRLTARPGRFSHRVATTVTFTVTDAGDPVPAATVSCLGKHATANGQGRARLKFRAGTHVGRHSCTAAMTAYLAGRTTIRVT